MIKLNTILFLFTLSNISIAANFLKLEQEGEKNKLTLAYKIYKSSQNKKVALLSTIHFAEKEFYDKHWQIMLQPNTTVLYEGMGLDEKGLEIYNKTPNLKKHEQLDKFAVMAKAFGLTCEKEFLLNSLPKENFIHADYSFDYVIKDYESFINETEHDIECLNKNEHNIKGALEHNLEDGFAYEVFRQIEKNKQIEINKCLESDLELASKLNEKYILEDITNKLNNFNNFVISINQHRESKKTYNIKDITDKPQEFFKIASDDVAKLDKNDLLDEAYSYLADAVRNLIFFHEIMINRNNIVLDKLTELLQKDLNTNIVIHYGAGHMPYFEEYLLKNGFSLNTEEWITAISY